MEEEILLFKDFVSNDSYYQNNNVDFLILLFLLKIYLRGHYKYIQVSFFHSCIFEYCLIFDFNETGKYN